MKHSKLLILLGLLIAFWGWMSAEIVTAEFRVYLGLPDKESHDSVIVSLPLGKLTPAMGLNVVEEIKTTFHMKDMILVASPNISTEIEHMGQIITGDSAGGHFGNPKIPFSMLKIMTKILSREKGIVHAQVGFGVDGKDEPAVEFFAREGEAFTLASRLNGHMLFILCTFTRKGETEPVPALISQVNAVYPSECLKAGVSGIVRVKAVVAPNGSVKSTSIESSPHPALSKAAEQAVLQWKFSSTPLRKADVTVTVEVNFSNY